MTLTCLSCGAPAGPDSACDRCRPMMERDAAADDMQPTGEHLTEAEFLASLDEPTPCPSCGLNTWDGLHRSGHAECVMAEVPK